MKHAIACSIETIASSGEEAWIITVDHADVSDAIILLTALRLGKIPQIKLTDHDKTALIRPDSLSLDSISVRISATWLDAVLSMLLNISLNGWTNTAHLDEDLPAHGADICVCVAVAPPNEHTIHHIHSSGGLPHEP